MVEDKTIYVFTTTSTSNRNCQKIYYINEHRVTSVLMITDVKFWDIGPYWPGLQLIDDKQLCSMAFLSIILQNGTYVCMYHNVY